MYEQSERGTIAEVLAHFEETEPRGEFVLVVEGAETVKEKKKKQRRGEEEE
jgi:16S rRNA (cytidine1402-2'-O)-methyltransferase